MDQTRGKPVGIVEGADNQPAFYIPDNKGKRRKIAPPKPLPMPNPYSEDMRTGNRIQDDIMAVDSDADTNTHGNSDTRRLGAKMADAGGDHTPSNMPDVEIHRENSVNEITTSADLASDPGVSTTRDLQVAESSHELPVEPVYGINNTQVSLSGPHYPQASEKKDLGGDGTQTENRFDETQVGVRHETNTETLEEHADGEGISDLTIRGQAQHASPEVKAHYSEVVGNEMKRLVDAVVSAEQNLYFMGEGKDPMEAADGIAHRHTDFTMES